MRPFELVDFLYEDFVRSLSGSLSEAARALAVTLRLAPERGIPWSRVFSHEVTLAAPALVAEGFAGVTPSQVEAAVFAHMLAVLEAFGTDRIEDLQVPASSELLALLAAMRDGRDAALARISATPEEQVVTYEHADRTTRQAIGEEARILRLGEGDDNRRPNGVPFETYERVSFGKQAVGFPASFALAFVVDPSTSRLRALSGLLRGVWLGLQMADDVVDWEGDAAGGRVGNGARRNGSNDGPRRGTACRARGGRARPNACAVTPPFPRSGAPSDGARGDAPLGLGRGASRKGGAAARGGTRSARLCRTALLAGGLGRRGTSMRAPPLPSAPWDFPYEPLGRRSFDGPGGDLIVATSSPLDEAQAKLVLRALGEREPATFETLLARRPLFWTRARGGPSLSRDALLQAFARAGLPVRYVASAVRASPIVAPPLVMDASMRVRADDWTVRADAAPIADPPTATRWFLGDVSGLAVDRARCGTGDGTRLAVIDDDGAEGELVGFERERAIGVAAISRVSPHGSLMAAWAVGARGVSAFPGVAPAASPRLYAIPKPGIDVVSLAQAVAEGVLDGADVVVCATYVEQTWSPMLDDALTVASRLGRRGRGTAVVMACGREASSPEDSIHASWSLSLGDPASDPRVFCIGPSGRQGGWFLWRDRRGKLRPFANRGPAVRWLAPGDDLADPLQLRDRWCHAESSGASALAAGALLLVLASNPSLTLHELDAIVTSTASAVSSHDMVAAPPVDPFDLLPRGVDADGHNAKHGYGRMNARRACLAARDPIAAELLAMGEDEAAVEAFDLVARARLYSPRTARWVVRRMLRDVDSARHGLRVALRHLRLVAVRPERARAHATAALARQLVLFLRALVARKYVPATVATELGGLARRLSDPSAEAVLLDVAANLWRGANDADEASAAKKAEARAPNSASVERESAWKGRLADPCVFSSSMTNEAGVSFFVRCSRRSPTSRFGRPLPSQRRLPPSRPTRRICCSSISASPPTRGIGAASTSSGRCARAAPTSPS